MKSKFNFKQRNKSIQGLRLFKDALPTKAKKIIKRKGEIYSKTLDNWKYLVGDDFFIHSYPKGFKKTLSKGKSLIVMVKHGYEVDLEYSKKDIIDKINYFFGTTVVENFIIKSFEEINDNKLVKKKQYVTKNRFSKKIYNIKNENLKNSLLELSRVFKKK